MSDAASTPATRSEDEARSPAMAPGFEMPNFEFPKFDIPKV